MKLWHGNNKNLENDTKGINDSVKLNDNERENDNINQRIEKSSVECRKTKELVRMQEPSAQNKTTSYGTIKTTIE